MSQSLQERLSYHPDPRCAGGSDRAVDARLNLIQTKVDFRDKVVLDLGCSGGMFSFALSRIAKKVIAVDGDREVIERNRIIQKELGITNLEFLHARIDADFIKSLGPVDVTLFLSVFHHLLAVSDAYDWNAGVTRSDAAEVIQAIHDATRVLVFEIGYPNEGYEWCARLPDYGKDWNRFVLDAIFQGRYKLVETLQPDIRLSWINRTIISRLGTPYQEDGLWLQRLKSAFRFDPRDLRKIYVGVRGDETSTSSSVVTGSKCAYAQ